MSWECPTFGVVVISHKPSKFWATLIGILVITAYAIFGAVIPVISTGDFNAVIPAANTRIVRNAIIFFCSLIWLFGLPAILRNMTSFGELYFYKDKLEIRSFLFHWLKVYSYKDITVNQHGSYGVTIHKRNLPGWKSPLNQLKALYIDGAGFSLSPKIYKDPNKLPLALNILKGATEFKEKVL